MGAMDIGKTAIVINRQAGTVRSMGAEAVRNLVIDAFGPDAALHLLDAADVADRIGALLRNGGLSRLIVGGGDGTLASAAGLAAGTGVAVGILPLGTMNLMAKTIGMEADLPAALQQLRSAEVKTVDAGRANGRLFLHHVSIGLQPRMVRIRERLGYSSRLTKMFSALRASLAVLLKPRSRRLGLEVDGRHMDVRTPALIISNNVYENSMMLRQARLDEGILGIYALNPMSFPAYLRLAIDLFRGRWRENLNVMELRGRDVQVTRRRRFGRISRSIKATLDGELVLFDLPLTVASDRAALRVLVPRTSPSAGDACEGGSHV